MTNNKRIIWIDYIKALAIFFVVFGHMIDELAFNLPFLYVFIYSFHVPLFFLISGFLFGIKQDIKQSSFKSYFMKKFKNIILPYFFFSLLISLMHLAKAVIITHDFSFFTQLSNVDILLKTLLLTNESVFSNLWFFPCMFITEIIFFLLNKYLNSKFKIIICILLGIVAFIYGAFIKVSLPLCLDNALLAILFYMIGEQLCKRKLLDNKIITFSSIIIFIVCNVLNYILFPQKLPIYLFYNLTFSSPILFLLMAITSFICFATLFKIFKKQPKFVTNISFNSGRIYGLHFIIQNVFSILLSFNVNNRILQFIICFALTSLSIILVLIAVKIYTTILSKLKRESKND